MLSHLWTSLTNLYELSSFFIRYLPHRIVRESTAQEWNEPDSKMLALAQSFGASCPIIAHFCVLLVQYLKDTWGFWVTGDTRVWVCGIVLAIQEIIKSKENLTLDSR